MAGWLDGWMAGLEALQGGAGGIQVGLGLFQLGGSVGGFEFGDLLGELGLVQVVPRFGHRLAVGQVGARSPGAVLRADQVGEIAPRVVLVEGFQDVQPAPAVLRGGPGFGQARLGDLLPALKGADAALQCGDVIGGLGHPLFVGRGGFLAGGREASLSIGQLGLGLGQLPPDALHVPVEVFRVA